MAEFKFFKFVMNSNAFVNVFCDLQESFHTFARCAGTNNRGYRSFFQLELNNSIIIAFAIFFLNRYANVELEE